MTPSEIADLYEAEWFSHPRPSVYVKPALKERIQLLVDKVREAVE